MKNILIVNKQEFEEKKKRFENGGRQKMQVLSDFDRTITYGLDDTGEPAPSVISQLRSDISYLGQTYFNEAHRLFDLYHPIEINPNVSLKEKKEKMSEWWRKHFDLISKSRLTRNLIKRVVKERPLQFRDGSLEFLSFLNENAIPLVFMSAAPGDMLVEYLKQNHLLFSNIYILANRYNFDKKGKAINVQEPIIHSFNKTEVTLDNTPIYKKIEKRKNVLLLGDGVSDIGMVEGFDYDALIKIGFLNENVNEQLELFKKNFDVVLLNDPDMSYVNKLIKEIVR